MTTSIFSRLALASLALVPTVAPAAAALADDQQPTEEDAKLSVSALQCLGENSASAATVLGSTEHPFTLLFAKNVKPVLRHTRLSATGCNPAVVQNLRNDSRMTFGFLPAKAKLETKQNCEPIRGRFGVGRAILQETLTVRVFDQPTSEWNLELKSTAFMDLRRYCDL